MTTPLELLQRIEDLRDQQAETLKRLKRSLAIQKLWPEAKFPVTTSIQTDSSKPRYLWMILKDANGNTKAASIPSLPDELLTSPTLVQFLKHDPRARSMWRRHRMTETGKRMDIKSQPYMYLDRLIRGRK